MKIPTLITSYPYDHYAPREQINKIRFYKTGIYFLRLFNMKIRMFFSRCFPPAGRRLFGLEEQFGDQRGAQQGALHGHAGDGRGAVVAPVLVAHGALVHFGGREFGLVQRYAVVSLVGGLATALHPCVLVVCGHGKGKS